MQERSPWSVCTGPPEKSGGSGIAQELARPGTQLFQHIGKTQAARAVDYQAHGAFRSVLDQINQRLGTGSAICGMGDQKVMLEVVSAVFFMRVSFKRCTAFRLQVRRFVQLRSTAR